MSTALRDTSVSLKELLDSRLNADPEVQAMLPPGGMLLSRSTPPRKWVRPASRGCRCGSIASSATRTCSTGRPTASRPTACACRHCRCICTTWSRPCSSACRAFPRRNSSRSSWARCCSCSTSSHRSAAACCAASWPAPLDELARVWDALERSYALSLAYEVSVVPIDARRDLVTGPPVMVFAPEIGIGAPVAP